MAKLTSGKHTITKAQLLSLLASTSNTAITSSLSSISLKWKSDGGDKGTTVNQNIKLNVEANVILPTIQLVSFGALTPIGYGGHKLNYKGRGYLVITSETNGLGAASTHFTIDSRNELVPRNGSTTTYGGAAPTFNGPYTVVVTEYSDSAKKIVTGRTATVTIAIESNTITITSINSGTNTDTETNNQLRTALMNATVGRTVKIRDGANFNPSWADWRIRRVADSTIVSTFSGDIATENAEYTVTSLISDNNWIKITPETPRGATINRLTLEGHTQKVQGFWFKDIKFAQLNDNVKTLSDSILKLGTGFDATTAVSYVRISGCKFESNLQAAPALSSSRVTTGILGALGTISLYIHDNEFVGLKDGVDITGLQGTSGSNTILGNIWVVGNTFTNIWGTCRKFTNVAPVYSLWNFDTNKKYGSNIFGDFETRAYTTALAGTYYFGYHIGNISVRGIGTPSYLDGALLKQTAASNVFLIEAEIKSNLYVGTLSRAIEIFNVFEPIIKSNTLIQDPTPNITLPNASSSPSMFIGGNASGGNITYNAVSSSSLYTLENGFADLDLVDYNAASITGAALPTAFRDPLYGKYLKDITRAYKSYTVKPGGSLDSETTGYDQSIGACVSTTDFKLRKISDPVNYDVLVTNDTELDQALTTYGANGGVIALSANGTFAENRTISVRPSNTLVIKGTQPSSRSTLSRIILDNTTNLTFENVNFGTNTAGSNTTNANTSVTAVVCVSSLVNSSKFATNTSFINCEFHGPALDPTSEIYATSGFPTNLAFSGDFFNLTTSNCYFHDLFSVVKPTRGYGVQRHEWNVIKNFASDAFSFGIDQDNYPLESMDILNNYIEGAIGKGSDPGNPHPDIVQFAMKTGNDYPTQNIRIIGNVYNQAGARGSTQLGFNTSAATSAYMFPVMKYNLYVTGDYGTQAAPDWGGVEGLYAFYNRVVRWDPGSVTSTGTNTAKSASRSVDYYNVYAKHVAEGYGSSGLQERIDCITLANNSTDYQTLFGTTSYQPLTKEECVAMYEPAVGSVLADMRGIYNYETGEYNPENEITVVKPEPLYNLELETLTTSNWVPVLGGGDNQTISVTGCEYRIASNMNGDSATSWTSSPSTVNEGQFVQLRANSSSSNSTTISTSVTVNGYTYSWNITTKASSLFDTVDNGGAAYSTITAPTSEPSQKKFVFAVRYKFNTLSVGDTIVGAPGAGDFTFGITSGNRANFRFVSSGTVTAIADAVFDTNWHTDVITINLSAVDDPNATIQWFRDGVPLTIADGSTILTTGAGTFNPSSDLGALGLFGRSGGNNISNAQIAFVYMDWGLAAYNILDFSDPANFNKFNPDTLGSNGSGITGSTPKIYFTGSGTEWNNGLANKGSITRTATKVTGTYSDVNPPVNTVAPVITGNALTGSTLTSSTGTFTGAASYNYQWTADGEDIPDATNSTYVVASDYQFKNIACKVTASNAAGSDTATSNSLKIAIDFGTKTRSGHGGFPLSVTAAAAISGTNATDWVIDERGHLVPSGTYGNFKTFASSSYSLTIAGIADTVHVRIVTGQAHIREVTSTGAGGTATVNSDSSSTSQLRTLLNVNLGANGALVGGDIVKCRDGHFNPLNTLATGGLTRPTNGWDASSSNKIYVESENPDLSVDENSNERRGGGFKSGRFYLLGASGTDWSAIEFRRITMYTDNAAITDNQSFIAFQSTTLIVGPSLREMRFELGASITGSKRNTFTNVNARINTVIDRCYFKGGGNGILGGSDATNLEITFNVFEEMSADPMQLNGGGHTIEDNFAFNYRPPAGAHPDFVQIIDGAGDKAQSIIRRNITVRNVGVANEDDSTGFFGGPASPDKAIDWIIENNIVISSQINNIRLGGMDNISNRGNTSLWDIHTTDDVATGGWNRVEPGYPGTGGNINYNVANVFDWSAQTGSTTTPNCTISEYSTAAYTSVFPDYPTVAGDFMHNRAMVIDALTPANKLVANGGAMNPDGTCNGALFPDGSWNDFQAYELNRLPKAV